MRNSKIKIFIIAGEVSGDILGGRIIEKMRDDAVFYGIGGHNMQAAGLKSLFPMSDLSVMGGVEVLAHARTLTRHIRETVDAIIDIAPDIVFTIDSPGFARSVIGKIRRRPAGQKLIANGMHFHHFVAPQVWAWRPRRAKKYAKTFDKLYAFFDFEVPFFTKYGLNTMVVGHPIADALVGKYSHSDKSDTEKIITLVPGSRHGEVKKLLPIFRGVVDTLARDGAYKFVIPTVETTADYVRRNTANWAVRPELVSSDVRYDLYAKTYTAIAASGTVSAELAMIHTPAIIMYKMNPITTMLVRMMIRTRWVSLVNILLQRTVYPELLGPAATAKNALDAFGELTKQSARDNMIDSLKSADKLWRHDDTDAITLIANDLIKTVNSRQ